MPTTLEVFISSKMVELKEERDALFRLIPSLNYGDIKLHAWVFEEDAGAVGRPIRDVYLNALQNSALYLGLFWQQYGEYTIDEFDRATEWGMERHIYVKDVDANKRNSKLVDFLNKHGAVTSGITAKWFKTTDELCAAVQRSIENWISDRLRFRSGSSAILATHPDDLSEKPDKLFGRDQLMSDVRALLEKHERVLLQGFGGMGKTALAATIAANWIKDGRGSILWLKAGSAEVDALFEALARPFNAQQAVASQTGDAKTKALRDLLRGSKATLLVLDDCWNNKALFDLLKAVPSDIALLITARQRYPISKIRSVDELALTDALALLAYHADHDLTHDTQAAALCKLLGNHAFAIEIAGKTLKVHNWTPADLITQIKDAPDKLTIPLELSETGRENVAKLIEVSLQALDAETRNVFLAFGAFFAPQLTPEMLTRYLLGTPEVSDEQLKALRTQNPDLKNISDNQLRPQLAQVILDNSDPTFAAKALDVLHLHGLANFFPITDKTVSFYRIHDLAYSYAKAQNSNEQHQSALQACLSFTKHYNEPSIEVFAALNAEFRNILGAADWAFKNGHYLAVDRFAWDLYANSQFLDYAGSYNEATYLLERATTSAENVNNKGNQAAHLGHLGAAYSVLGQNDKAIICHTRSLSISREIGIKGYEGIALGNLGTVYFAVGQLEQAIGNFEQALVISRETGDKRNEAGWLVNIGDAYVLSEQLEKAETCYEQALVISRETGDKRDQANAFGGLGNIFNALGKVEEAMEYFQKSSVIRRTIGDLRGLASVNNNIGLCYEHHLKDNALALDYYQQAYELYTIMEARDYIEITNQHIMRVKTKINNKRTDSNSSS